jgi:hypothetical protein
MFVRTTGIAVNNAICRAVLAAHRDCQAVVVDIPIAGAGVDTIGNDYLVPVVSIIDSGLYVVEIREAIVIDGDCPGVAWDYE